MPLAVAIAVLAIAWLEISLNFSFDWFTDGDLGNGLALPCGFHLIAPTAFVSWAIFFAGGADRPAGGAFGRVLSTPIGWVFASSVVSLFCGVAGDALGLVGGPPDAVGS